jgi:hypothetical protein
MCAEVLKRIFLLAFCFVATANIQAMYSQFPYGKISWNYMILILWWKVSPCWCCITLATKWFLQNLQASYLILKHRKLYMLVSQMVRWATITENYLQNLKNCHIFLKICHDIIFKDTNQVAPVVLAARRYTRSTWLYYLIAENVKVQSGGGL